MPKRQATRGAGQRWRPISLITLIPLLWLAACVPVERQQISVASSTPTTAVSGPSATPGVQLVTAEPQSTAVPACNESRGTVSRSYLTAKELPGRLYYTLYLPPCYDQGEAYPTVYLLHGKSYQDDQWTRLGLPEIMDAGIAAGTLPPFIVIMPYDKGWEDPDEGRLDYAIVRSLVPWIDKNYKTYKDSGYRAVGGLSRGAAWAFHLGVDFPGVFGVVGLHSPAFFRGDKREMETMLEELASMDNTRIILDIGDEDPELNYTTRFESLLTELGIPHSWAVSPGTHTEAYWRDHLAGYLQAYSQDW
jgi:enterochelin esterase-like enzyme